MRKHAVITSRALFAWVALIVLGLRGLIPVGYMPDFSGHNLLVICDGFEHQASTAYAGHARNEDGCPHHKHVCSFGVGTLFGFDGIKPPVITAPVYAMTMDSVFLPSPLARSDYFSNASSRSPPSFS